MNISHWIQKLSLSFDLGLNILFDLPGMLEEVVFSIEDNAVLAVVKGCLSGVKTKLDQASLELGVASVKL